MNTALLHTQMNHLLKRLPQFELSYETISYKKVSPDYNICLAIPNGKKVLIWFTFHQDYNTCYMIDLNKDKKIYKMCSIPNLLFDQELAKGTLIYGTVLDKPGLTTIIIEDIFYYNGIPINRLNNADKFDFLEQFMRNAGQMSPILIFQLPVIWESNVHNLDEYPIYTPPLIGYAIHHIQYRAFYEIMPYLNIFINRKIITNNNAENVEILRKPYPINALKPQYKYTTVFHVTADLQYDIYNLFAYGKNNSLIFYNIAYIPNYKSSVQLNSVFRNIRENKSIDYIEESDDEDDFQNINVDKYVDLNKSVLMECSFNTKFKRWVPMKIVDKKSKVIHISQL
jgi:hypothetical protein